MFYLKHCLEEPIVPAMVGGGIISAIDVAMGKHVNGRTIGTYIVSLYAYNVLQCPMEAIHGRRSLLHNFLSAGMLGSYGVKAGLLGVPFVDPYKYSRVPGLTPPVVAFVVYGGLASGMAALGGKSL